MTALGSARSVRVLAAVALAIAVGFPLARLAWALVADPGALAVLVRPAELRAAGNTALLAVGTTAFAVLAGVPLGVLIARADLPGAARWRALATLPYVVPPYVAAIAWLALANPTTGWLNLPLAALGLPKLDVYGLPGMVWVMGLENTPLVMLATADALGRMDASLEEQARIAGAGPWQVLRRVTLPLAVPAIVAAGSAVFAGSAASFGVPYLLGSGSAEPAWVLTTRIAQHLDLDPATGRPAATALSVALLALSATIPALVTGWVARRSFTTVGGKATRKAPFALGAFRPVAVAAVAAFVGIGAILPLGALILLSVTDQLGAPPGPGNWSLAHYAEVLGRGRDQLAIARSVGLAAGAATVAVAFGGLIAVLDRPSRGGSDGGRWLGWLARLPYAIPGTVLALGLLLAWSQEVRLIVFDRLTVALALGDSAWLLGLAYTVKFLALPTGAIDAALRGLDPALDEAARVHGAGFWTAVRRITVPILAPNLAAAWFVVFLPAFTEVTMSVLLAGPNSRVVGVLLFELQTYGDPPGAAALAVVVTAAVIAGNAAVVRLSTRGG
ncbi:MAG: iron ABC transporter permease [Myxococcota bacterium]